MSYAVIIEYDQNDYPAMPPVEVEWHMADLEEARDHVEECRQENGPDNTKYTIVELIEEPVFGVN